MASARETLMVPEVWAPDLYGQTAAMRPAAQQDVDMSGPGEAINEYLPLP
jgi:hypothetical protein